MRKSCLLLLLSYGLSLAAHSNHSMGMEVQVSEHQKGMAEITFINMKGEFTVFSLQDPNRIVVDVAGIEDSQNITITGYNNSSIVKNVRHGVRNNSDHRYVFDISTEYEKSETEWLTEEDKIKLIIEASHKANPAPEVASHDKNNLSRKPTNNSQISKEVTLNALGSANAVASAAAGDAKTTPQAVCSTWKYRVEQAMVNQTFGFGAKETYTKTRRLAALEGDYYYFTGPEDAIGQIIHRAFNRYSFGGMESIEEWENAIEEVRNDTFQECLGKMFRKQDHWAINERARTLID